MKKIIRTILLLCFLGVVFYPLAADPMMFMSANSKQAWIKASSTSVPFGSVTAGTTSTVTLTLSVEGNPIYITTFPAVAGTNSTDFSATWNCKTTAVWEMTYNCQMTVSFVAPTTTGAKNANIPLSYTW